MQRDPVVSKASELLRLGLFPSPAELRAGKVSNGCHLIIFHPTSCLWKYIDLYVCLFYSGYPFD